MKKKNIFVIGYNEFNLGELRAIKRAEEYNFIPVLPISEAQQIGVKSDVEALLDKCRKAIDGFDGNVDAIIGFYDFPITLMVFILCREYGLRAPSVESGLMCEHKYWSRNEQSRVIEDHVPGFEAVNPFEVSKINEIGLQPPFWLKPIKAHSSQLGFKINDQSDLDEALKKIRKEIDVFAGPFNYLMTYAAIPEEIKRVDGRYCIAEQLVGGEQCTLSGYVYDGEAHTYGIVDSINYEETSSFFCYLLEINPRMSQSHSDLYAKVSGHSNHQILVQLALGEKPDFAPYAGEYKCAGKFHYRTFEEGRIKKAPSSKDVENIEREFPQTLIFANAREGDKLTPRNREDSYSYLLAKIFTGAENEAELFENYKKIVKKLNIAIES